MALGAVVRRAFGPYERQVAEAWRAIFFNLDDWMAMVRDWAPGARRILELGCGEGYSTERLARLFPEAEILAVDIAANIGRLYAGPADRVSFRIAYAEDLAAELPGHFDLVVLTDVLHHVPLALRPSLLGAARDLLAPGGVLAFKDWERRWSPIHAATYSADRWLTGDRIAYLTVPEARAALGAVFGEAALGRTVRIAPWAHNYAIRVAR
ncbi:MAG: class I SAM-dependent methyltransferase [Proteobacteria bacterium]|nr:class I SAM-dependent methyltransferase [Pseudomonadota bacterium]